MVDDKDWIRIGAAQIRYYLHIDPDGLSDEEFCRHFKELEYIRKLENKNG